MKNVIQQMLSQSTNVLLLAWTLSIVGCGGSSDKIVSATGKVTRNNIPVPGIVVSFVPQGKSESGVSTGTTDQSGQFSLTVFKTGQSGAVAGSHKVWVSLPRKPEIDKKKGNPGQEAELPTDTQEILDKYGRLDSTPLIIEVKGDAPLPIKLD